MTTTSCTLIPITTSPAPRAARGCSSRPARPSPAEARGFRTESRVARPRRVCGGGQRPTEPRASGRLGTTRAGGARGSGDRERPVTLTAAASGQDAVTVGVKRDQSARRGRGRAADRGQLSVCAHGGPTFLCLKGGRRNRECSRRRGNEASAGRDGQGGGLQTERPGHARALSGTRHSPA